MKYSISRFGRATLSSILLMSTLLTGASAWGTEMQYNLINLSESASQEVPNEVMYITMQAEHRATKPSASADGVNRDMQWALSLVKKHKALKYETGQYNTYPMYRKERIGEWQSSQQLSIESEDVTLLSNIMGQLQERLKMQNMAFKPSEKTQQKIEDKLVVQAIKNFNARARIIQKSLNGADFKLVNMDVNTQNNHHPMAYQSRGYEMASAKMSAPAVEQGTSKMTVSVNGQIQIQ